MRSIFGGVTEYNPDINNLAWKRSASTDSESDKPVCKSDKVYYYQLLMKKPYMMLASNCYLGPLY